MSNDCKLLDETMDIDVEILNEFLTDIFQPQVAQDEIISPPSQLVTFQDRRSGFVTPKEDMFGENQIDSSPTQAAAFPNASSSGNVSVSRRIEIPPPILRDRLIHRPTAKTQDDDKRGIKPTESVDLFSSHTPSSNVSSSETMIRRPTNCTTARNAVYFGKITHPCTRKWREIVDEIAAVERAWSNEIASTVLRRLQALGISGSYIKDVGNPNIPWKLADYSTFVAKTRQRFIDAHKGRRRTTMVSSSPARCGRYPVSKTSICFNWNDHYGTQKWLAIVQDFSRNIDEFPEWDDVISEYINDTLADTCDALFLHFKDRQGNLCTSIEIGLWLDATPEEVLTMNKRQFLKFRKQANKKAAPVEYGPTSDGGMGGSSPSNGMDGPPQHDATQDRYFPGTGNSNGSSANSHSADESYSGHQDHGMRCCAVLVDEYGDTTSSFDDNESENGDSTNVSDDESHYDWEGNCVEEDRSFKAQVDQPQVELSPAKNGRCSETPKAIDFKDPHGEGDHSNNVEEGQQSCDFIATDCVCRGSQASSIILSDDDNANACKGQQDVKQDNALFGTALTIRPIKDDGINLEFAGLHIATKKQDMLGVEVPTSTLNVHIQSRNLADTAIRDGRNPKEFVNNNESFEEDAVASAANTRRNSQLLEACQKGDLEAVLILLENNADPNAMTSRRPLLHQRCLMQLESMVNFHDSPQVNLVSAEVLKWTPLHHASANGHGEVVKALLRHNADPNACSSNGWSPLHCACTNGRFEAVKELLVQNADPTIKNMYGNTPLHEASREGHAEVVKLLLGQNIDHNVKNWQGKAPLDLASEFGDETVMMLLRKHDDDQGKVRTRGEVGWVSTCGCETTEHSELERQVEIQADENEALNAAPAKDIADFHSS